MLEFNQGDVNYIVGQCAIRLTLANKYCHILNSQNLQNQRREAARYHVCVFCMTFI